MSTNITDVPVLERFSTRIGYGIHVSTVIEPGGAETVLIDRRRASYDGAARITRVYGDVSGARQRHAAMVASA